MKRLLNCYASQIAKMTPKEMLESIRASEGRIIATESTVISPTSVIHGITDAELKSAFGADIILYNWLDVFDPMIPGLDVSDKSLAIKRVKELTGRIVGVNLEPVDPKVVAMGEIDEIAKGRLATVETVERAIELGADIILLTGNPGTGVTNAKIVETLKKIKPLCQDKIILMAGKMHAAGSVADAGENIINEGLIKELVDAGADIICMPSPGTVPGIGLDYIQKMVKYAHALGALTMTAIGTSQEGASKETINQIALMCKMSGTDIHHIGDANVERFDNIYHYGLAIRGARHTYMSMAKSVKR